MIIIVVPCYNSESTVQRTVKSLCNQTEKCYQIVIVDDGSTDNTARICDNLALADKRIKVVHQKNKGLMGAWKSGVIESEGDFIAFCDADDHVDNDLVDNVNKVISEYDPDIIIYGMIAEYSNGDSRKSANKLEAGYYDEKKIKNTILPKLLFNGTMQSELIIKSRCAKVIRKEILLSEMSHLNEKVSVGEDQLTTFTLMQVARSLYCMGDYCPYHYVRTSGSMIGRFDPKVFKKLDLLYNEMKTVAGIYKYPYVEQILQSRLSSTLVYVKKYICKSNYGYKQVREEISAIRRADSFKEITENCSIRRYKFSSRIFAGMLIRGWYLPLYLITRLFENIRGRDV